MTRRSQVVKEVKADIKTAKKMRLPWWALLCVGLGTIPLYFLFDHFERSAITLPVLTSAAVLAFALDIKWNWRRCVWFWMTMAVVAALHVLLIVSVPWTDKWVPARVTAGAASLDLIAILAILEIVGNLVEGPKPNER